MEISPLRLHDRNISTFNTRFQVVVTLGGGDGDDHKERYKL